MSKKRLYIAYGSNLNMAQMALRCPTARPVGTAAIEGYELLFRGTGQHGVATIEPREGSSVPVLVWDIKEKDELALDRYEAYPTLYGKQMMGIVVDGKAVSAMVYVMVPGLEAGFPTQSYLDIIIEGYRNAGFDPCIIDAAIERTDELIAVEQERLAIESGDVFDFDPGIPSGLEWR